MQVRPVFLLLILASAGCTRPEGLAEALAPRAAETIDPRLPVGQAAPAAPTDPALVARLSALVAQAQAGDRAFAEAAAAAERLVVQAGGPGTEGWVSAQQAISAAVAAREPTALALGEVDALGARMIVQTGGIAPANREAIQAAASRISALSEAQARRLSDLQARLGA